MTGSIVYNDNTQQVYILGDAGYPEHSTLKMIRMYNASSHKFEGWQNPLDLNTVNGWRFIGTVNFEKLLSNVPDKFFHH